MTVEATLSRTEETILGAFAELIEEIGSDDVSYKLIARRAGVGERTIFRYYPTRTELLVGAGQYIERTVFAAVDFDDLFDVPMTIRRSMEAYDARPQLAHVVAESAMRGAAGRPSPRRDRITAAVDAAVPEVSATERRRIAAALAHLDSAGTWVTFRQELGLGRDEIADAAGWAAEAVLDAVRDSNRS